MKLGINLLCDFVSRVPLEESINRTQVFNFITIFRKMTGQGMAVDCQQVLDLIARYPKL